MQSFGFLNAFAKTTVISAALRPAISLRTLTMAAEAPIKSHFVNLAMCQMTVGSDKHKNLATAREGVQKAVKDHKAHIVCLPECFNTPYSNDCFPEYAEKIPFFSATSASPSLCGKENPTAFFLSVLSKELGIYLVGGSIPEKEENAEGKVVLFNTSMVFSPSGALIAKHRKMHLFDIDVPGKIKFKESDTLSPGSSVTTFDVSIGQNLPAFKVGLGICYDLRFPEYAQLCASRGVKMLIYPGAFNTVTGPVHWELLQRGRALDNQLFVVTCSPARNPDSKYQAWGGSSVVDPWGTVLATTGHDSAIVAATVDMSRVEEVRASIPIRMQKRLDIYELIDKTKAAAADEQKST